MDDRSNKAYASLPERLYVVQDGKVVYQVTSIKLLLFMMLLLCYCMHRCIVPLCCAGWTSGLPGIIKDHDKLTLSLLLYASLWTSGLPGIIKYKLTLSLLLYASLPERLCVVQDGLVVTRCGLGHQR